jgi:hypothetical protein
MAKSLFHCYSTAIPLLFVGYTSTSQHFIFLTHRLTDVHILGLHVINGQITISLLFHCYSTAISPLFVGYTSTSQHFIWLTHRLTDVHILGLHVINGQLFFSNHYFTAISLLFHCYSTAISPLFVGYTSTSQHFIWLTHRLTDVHILGLHVINGQIIFSNHYFTAISLLFHCYLWGFKNVLLICCSHFHNNY